MSIDLKHIYGSSLIPTQTPTTPSLFPSGIHETTLRSIRKCKGLRLVETILRKFTWKAYTLRFQNILQNYHSEDSWIKIDSCQRNTTEYTNRNHICSQLIAQQCGPHYSMKESSVWEFSGIIPPHITSTNELQMNHRSTCKILKNLEGGIDIKN